MFPALPYFEPGLPYDHQKNRPRPGLPGTIPDTDVRAIEKDNEAHLTIAAIPAFNEEKHIAKMIIGCRKYVDKVVVVDNGSSDATAEIAEALGAIVIKHPETIDISGNGHSFALEKIISIRSEKKENNTGVFVTLYGDGTNDPDNIPELIDCVTKEGFDVAAGTSSFENKNNYSGFVACSAKCFGALKLYNGGDIAKQILIHAKNNNLKIKYLHIDKNQDFNVLNHYKIGVVCPAYNEELLIEETIKGIPKYVDRIYVIDDHSTDRTPEIVKSITDHRIVSVRHEINKGVGAAIVTGYKLALEDKMGIVAVMAGDNQMDPEQLPRLLMPVIEGRADYTKGNRLISKDFRQGMSKWRFLGNAMLTMITKIGSGYWHVMDPQNGYTAISRQALEVINLDSIYPYYGYCNDLLIKLNTFGMRIEDVVMPARYGREKSKIKYSSYIAKVAPMIFRGFLWRLKTKYIVLDFHPLVFFYTVSMALVPVGVLFSLWIFFQKWYHIPVSQNFPLLAVFITLMGLQFLLFAMLFDMQADKSRSGTV